MLRLSCRLWKHCVHTPHHCVYWQAPQHLSPGLFHTRHGLTRPWIQTTHQLSVPMARVTRCEPLPMSKAVICMAVHRERREVVVGPVRAPDELVRYGRSASPCHEASGHREAGRQEMSWKGRATRRVLMHYLCIVQP